MKIEIIIIKLYSNIIKFAEKILLLLGFQLETAVGYLKIFNKIKHKMIERVIRRDTRDIIKSIESKKAHTVAAKKKRPKEYITDRVWVMWWQNEIPPIIQFNITKMRHIFGNRLVVINKLNYRDYLEIDDEMLKIINSNSISLTFLSDYIRTGLLFNYGGLWVDSTMYITDLYSDEKFIDEKNFFTSYGESWYANKFVPSGRWTIYFMGGTKNQLYFKLANEIIRYYLLNPKKMPDYFVTDYALNIAYEDNIGSFKDRVNQLNPINQNVLQLSQLMNQKFDEMKWQQLQNNSFAFKLTYKKKYVSQVGGEQTFFGYLYGDLSIDTRSDE